MTRYPVKLSKTTVFLAVIGFTLPITLMLFVTVTYKDDYWQTQWQMWWTLLLADKIGQSEATIIDQTQIEDKYFITYQYKTQIENNESTTFEKTEEVSKTIYEQAAANKLIMVEYDVTKPAKAGIIGNHNPIIRFVIIIPFTLFVFYMLALLLGMKPLHRSRVQSQVVGRLASRIQSSRTVQNDDTPPPSLAAMFFMALILLTIFGLAFVAIVLWIIELFK